MFRMSVSRTLSVVLAGFVACACNSPQRRSSGLTQPSGSGAGNGTVSGALTSFSSGQAVGGGTVKLGSASTISDAGGGYQLNGTPESGTAIVTANATGYVFRGVAFSLTPSKAGASLDLIRDAAPFSFTFYRQFARNAFEGTQLEALKRWTVNPSFYFQLITDAGTVVPPDIIQSMKDNLTKSVPELSGNKFSVAAFDQGDGPKDATDGWVNVIFSRTNLGYLGYSSVGGNQGTINIRYDPTLVSNSLNNPYNCSSIPLAVIDHEVIHTMGFWHTENALTDEFSGNGCPGVGRPSATVFHASIVYSRPVGNVDPDVDPLTTAHALAPGGRRPGPTIACDFSTFRRR
jgi:hypothetical protein